MNNTFVLIMAGGEGTRFMPLSTPERPKQFLNLVGDGTFIQQTRRRIASLVSADRIYVATNDRYVPLVREQLPDIPEANIIGEPRKKNTAPCIAYAARLISGRDPSAVMVVLPSDHVIQKQERFEGAIVSAVHAAHVRHCLLTLGIRPGWPASDYGYIQSSNRSIHGCPSVCEVSAFVEKPDEMTARRYIDEGNYYWNSGMFIWRADDILQEIALHLPEMDHLLKEFSPDDNFRRWFFSEVSGISIDYGIMEKSKKTAVIPCDLGWSDVGTWEGLYRLSLDEGLSISADVMRAAREQLGLVLPSNEKSLPCRVDKPWGHEEIWAHTKDYVGKVLVINKPHRLSYQYHRVKEETIRILEGVVDLEYERNGEKKTLRLRPGDVHHVPPLMKHRFIAVDDCRVLEVSTPYLDDVVRLSDDYGRSGKDDETA